MMGTFLIAAIDWLRLGRAIGPRLGAAQNSDSSTALTTQIRLN
jgi:hypothetical protein